MWFSSNALEKALNVVLAENSDLKQRVRDVEAEKSLLLDRIMALTSPGALREVKRPLSKGTKDQPSPDSGENNRAHRFPGSELMVEPSRPPAPPSPFPPPPSKKDEAS